MVLLRDVILLCIFFRLTMVKFPGKSYIIFKLISISFRHYGEVSCSLFHLRHHAENPHPSTLVSLLSMDADRSETSVARFEPKKIYSNQILKGWYRIYDSTDASNIRETKPWGIPIAFHSSYFSKKAQSCKKCISQRYLIAFPYT